MRSYMRRPRLPISTRFVGIDIGEPRRAFPSPTSSPTVAMVSHCPDRTGSGTPFPGPIRRSAIRQVDSEGPDPLRWGGRR